MADGKPFRPVFYLCDQNTSRSTLIGDKGVRLTDAPSGADGFGSSVTVSVWLLMLPPR